MHIPNKKHAGQMMGRRRLAMFALQRFRNHFFEEVGKKRLLRIMFCSFSIGMVWIFADFISGSYEPRFRDDLICLGLGIISERLIPWGK